MAVSTVTGTLATIAESKGDASPILLSVSNDGRRVLYLMAGGRPQGQAYVWDASTGASLCVPLDPVELATDGVLSGDGRIAFV